MFDESSSVSFDVSKWDGLAKIGTYTINGKSFQTPALFPVVHPTFQEIPTKELKTRFGFDQLITSTYLLSKKYSRDNLPAIHAHLDTDAIIMMDSGAYQLMVYGDVELGPETTMEYQKQVGTDIGVIMDHPIGYDIPYGEAKKRVETTVERVFQSIQYMDEKTAWTLPIQGGRYISLIREYLDKVLVPQVLDKYRFYALGSVVQVMIKQDYETMVKMILETRKKLPVTYPLHLFGAGHPAMFALATYLGCDSFDSAAYSLMAKDGRYMTTSGTYMLKDIEELPCVCPICSSMTAQEMRDAENSKVLLSEHNLWVSAQEIRNIRNAIRRGDLRDLVTARMNSVPGLARATRLAFKLLEEDELIKKWISGTPISKQFAVRFTFPHDLEKPELRSIKDSVSLSSYARAEIIILFLDWRRSLYKRIPDEQIRSLSREQVDSLFIASPIFGIIPFGVNEIFPLSQYTSDIDAEDFTLERIKIDLQELKKHGVKKVRALVQEDWDLNKIREILLDFETDIQQTQKIVSELRNLFSAKVEE